MSYKDKLIHKKAIRRGEKESQLDEISSIASESAALYEDNEDINDYELPHWHKNDQTRNLLWAQRSNNNQRNHSGHLVLDHQQLVRI